MSPALTMAKLSPADVERWRRQVVRVAQANIGYGEAEANNQGPFLRAIGAPPGSEWCAYLAWYTHKRGAVYAEIVLPYRGSGGAKKLGRAIAACPNGFFTMDPALALPGDVVITCREEGPVRPTGRGHARIVELPWTGSVLPMIEGNAGRFPAKVRRIARAGALDRLVGIYGLR